MSGDKNPSSFTIGNTAQEKGLDYVPECYVVSPSKSSSSGTEKARIPTIDMSRLRMNGNKRSIAIEELGEACRHRGFFQHSQWRSNPVRYGTSLKDGADKVQFWRVFLKHYAHPLDAWIDSWPHNPPQYREKMGKYCAQVRNLALELMGIIIESLRISPNRLTPKMDRGMQIMAVNCYPPCPKPEMALGLPPHSDYTCLTIILQSSTGLEILDTDDGNWKMVPELHGALQVHIGDHFEVMSNGVYKSVVHRATLNSEKTRISIASLHSLGMDDKMETANELIDEQNPKRYKESSFRDFLDFLANNDIADGKHFIDTLKI
ncbi:hypothetical protein E1A91_D07G052900v1 [Gossypium mustelinum]|uniref:Fe2OG dioxygenase domain-containing protein n=1 Tax=Gossypium mustelinum TaxID=34275 RepID=A0A5D2U6X4_GOSMU|nr:hypothetical protein E1A91_D07G052900v1 [Gossypium mustelinum]